MTWNYPQTLADGDVTLTGTRKINQAQCLESAVSSVDLLLLHAELRNQPSGKDLSNG